MPERSMLAEMALAHDTVVSRAFLAALGVPRPWRFRRDRQPRSARAAEFAERARYRGMRECFRNEGSPMDMLR